MSNVQNRHQEIKWIANDGRVVEDGQKSQPPELETVNEIQRIEQKRPDYGKQGAIETVIELDAEQREQALDRGLGIGDLWLESRNHHEEQKKGQKTQWTESEVQEIQDHLAATWTKEEAKEAFFGRTEDKEHSALFGTQGRLNYWLHAFHAKESRTLEIKASDYAGADDRLLNFRQVSYLTGQAMAQICLHYMLKHAQAIVNILRRGRPIKLVWMDGEHEGFLSRVLDLRNYLVLLVMCIEAEQGG
jgi:hypothetical protein